MLFSKIFRSLKKIFRNFYFKHFAKIQFFTVQLRGSLNTGQVKYFQAHKSNIFSSKKFLQNNLKINEKNILEIGFGDGGHIVKLAQENKLQTENKKTKIFGVEMDKICIYKTLKKIDENGLENIFIFNQDARIVVANFQEKSLDQIYVLFPDPWRKRRDHKRRLVNVDFLKKLLRILKDNGKIILATDWTDYAESMGTSLAALHDISVENLSNSEKQTDNQEINISNIYNTKFAKRAKKEGREISIFIVSKVVV